MSADVIGSTLFLSAYLLGETSVDLFVPTLIYMVGLVLIVTELFIPSGGLISIAAVICLAYSIYQIFQFSPSIGVLVVLVTAAYLVWILRWGVRRLTFTGSLETSVASGTDVEHARAWVGQVGRAVTPLRPAGVALFGTRRLDVVTGGGFVDSGGDVEIIRADGNRIVVKPCKPTP